MYTIEVVLHKGFSFGDFDRVQVQLRLPGRNPAVSSIEIFRLAEHKNGIKEEIIKKLQYADVTVAGRKMLGTRFVFRALELGRFFCFPD